MSSSRRENRRRHREDDEEPEKDDRWLVSYADMMTLLFALFMILFAISSVNTSKFHALQRTLKDAFSGHILSGGKALEQTGADTSANRSTVTPPLASLQAHIPINAAPSSAVAREDEDFQKLKRRIEALAANAGLRTRVQVTIRHRGLVVRLLTDKVFFDSGQATIKPAARVLLDKIAVVIRDEHEHPIVIEGHTDSQPIHGSQYPSNWELSGARAAAVVRDFIASGVLKRRLSLAGYADDQPIASNSTATGRSRNRRVEIVLSRLNRPSASDPLLRDDGQRSSQSP